MKRKGLLIFLVLIIASGMVFARGQQDSSANKTKGTVQIAYVEWARAVAISHVAAVILEDMGYEVSLKNVANAAMWASVSTGDSDALLCAWLPNTHADLYAEYQDGFEDLGPNYLGAKLGFVVPGYVEFDSSADLAANIDMFDGKIIGIDPGAGMSKTIEAAIADNTYGLGAFEYVSGSDAIMVAALKDAIENGKWVVVPGWQPHWMFGEWDLKILDDPEGIWGTEETINTIVADGLKNAKPEVYAFFKDFDWTQLSLATVLVDNKNGMDPYDSAKKFVTANKAKIDSIMAK